MSDDRHGSEDLVYMVTGVDENGDTHVFVTGNLHRAEARRRQAEAEMSDVKATWLAP